MITVNRKSSGLITQRIWHFLLQCAVLLNLMLWSGEALAAGNNANGNNPVEIAMCNIILIMMGTTGKAIATVGIIGLGIGALFGKVSWNVAMLSVLSIGLIFGAASIVGEMGSGPGFALIMGMEYNSGGGGGGNGFDMYGSSGALNEMIVGDNTCHAGGSLVAN